MKIDENTYSKNANFKFDKQVTNIFDSHVRKSVPMYDEFHKITAEMSDWFLENGTNMYDIGSSTCEVFKNIIPRHSEKEVHYFGIDKSIDMIEKSVENKTDKNISILNADICNEDVKIHNASFITSILTMQFIPKRKRLKVLKKIYEGLNIGGAFIIIEKIIGSNAKFDEIFTELYHDFKMDNGLTEVEVIGKAKAIRGVMSPNTLDENIKLMKNSGFKDVEVFFRWCNFVGIIAIK